MSAGPARPADAFERLNRASVALLDPLFESDADASPGRSAARLGDAIMHCAQEADAVGLRSLNYLATLMVPYLKRESVSPGWPATRERIEGWVAQVIAFCAGHASAAEAPQLVLELQSWPGFPSVPEQFVALITARLRDDAARIAELAGDTPAAGPVDAVPDGRESAEPADAGAEEAAAEEAAAEEAAAEETAAAEHAEDHVASRAAVEVDAAPESGGAAETELGQGVPLPGTVARDELEMLAEAMAGLDEEVLAPLAAIALPPAADDRAEVAELADLCRERLGNLAAAMRYVGLEPAADLLEPCRDSLAAWRDAPATCGPQMPELLTGLASALEAFFRSPGESTLQGLQARSVDPRWPVRPERPASARLDALRGLSVVGSRQVDAPDLALAPGDLSLEVPADADASVLDHLLRELPALSAEFAMYVEQLVAVQPGELQTPETPGGGSTAGTSGHRDALSAARRVAHTLKGAANTVGIRGIATLTHRIEDLLQLMVDRDEAPDAGTGAALAEASDCLGEMTDAVVGLGEGPADAPAVCRMLGELIARRVAARSAEAVAAAAPAGVRVASSVEDAVEAPAEASVEASVGHAVGAPADRQRGTPPEVLAEAQSTPVPGRTPGASPVEGELMRVPAALLDRVLDLAGEASILLARVQEQVEQLGEVRHGFRIDSDRLRDLSAELERLVDIRGVSLAGRRGRGDFDPLELDDYDELHTVSRRIGEAAADARVMDQQIERQGASLAEAVGQLERVQTDLREAVMQSRLVAVRAIAPRLQRVVRQAARMTGRAVALEIVGEDTEVDARLLQALLEPIAHLLRNAVDHGIEPEDERLRAGKPAEGRVSLSFRRDGRRLLVRCADDGRGLDFEAIRRRAGEAGLPAPGAATDEEALARLVLAPGFSTREQPTLVSGRGIGMDVVQRAVQALRGGLRLANARGGGLQVDLDVPEGMVAIPVVLVRTPSHVLALSIRGVDRILPAEGAVRDDSGALRFVAEDGVLPAMHLDELMGLPAGFFAREAEAARLAGARRGALARQPEGGVVALLVRRAGGDVVAVIAPAPGQTRNVVVRPLPAWLPRIAAVEGATVLGDGAVATVLDLPALVAPGGRLAPSTIPERPQARLPLCLVADDSVSVRRSMELFLSDLGFEVASAGDGVEALALAQRRVPALAIVDLEMPRMNGVDLCRALRADERTRAVPVIMITSRSSERHRALAMEAGVDVFLTKPYGEDELAAEIRRCLVAPPAKV